MYRYSRNNRIVQNVLGYHSFSDSTGIFLLPRTRSASGVKWSTMVSISRGSHSNRLCITPATAVKNFDFNLGPWPLDRHSNSPWLDRIEGVVSCLDEILYPVDLYCAWPLTFSNLQCAFDRLTFQFFPLWLLDPVLDPGRGCLYRVYWSDHPLYIYIYIYIYYMYML